MSENEAISLVIVTYISALVYLAMSTLAIHNTYKYLYLKKKYSVFPICIFYVLAIPLIILRFFENFWAVQLVTYNTVIILDLQIMVMQAIALTQILVMIELTVLIEISMKPEKFEGFKRLITVLRVIVVVSSFVLIGGWLASAVRVMIDGNKMDDRIALDNAANVYGGYSFLIITIALFLSIILVIWRLKVKQRVEGLA